MLQAEQQPSKPTATNVKCVFGSVSETPKAFSNVVRTEKHSLDLDVLGIAIVQVNGAIEYLILTSIIKIRSVHKSDKSSFIIFDQDLDGDNMGMEHRDKAHCFKILLW